MKPLLLYYKFQAIMLKSTEPKYSYGDIFIKPAVLSDVKHRIECHAYTSEGSLPIFTAPMDTVVGKNSFNTWKENRIIPIYPRTISYSERVCFMENGDWTSFGLDEFVQLTKSYNKELKGKILIEMANGHLEDLYKIAGEAKEQFPNLTLMVGNIGNAETYNIACDCEIDYIRLGIGGGSGCITATQTGIHYPMASLIHEAASRKMIRLQGFRTKIIADGGIKSYKDICVALALGADYVMIGGLLCGLKESEAPIIENEDGSLSKKFYGMASREGQTAMYGSKIKTVEGKSKLVPITGTIPGWVENATDYIRSMMSYIGAKNLEEIYEKAECIIGSQDTLNRINK